MFRLAEVDYLSQGFGTKVMRRRFTDKRSTVAIRKNSLSFPQPEPDAPELGLAPLSRKLSISGDTHHRTRHSLQVLTLEDEGLQEFPSFFLDAYSRTLLGNCIHRRPSLVSENKAFPHFTALPPVLLTPSTLIHQTVPATLSVIVISVTPYPFGFMRISPMLILGSSI